MFINVVYQHLRRKHTIDDKLRLKRRFAGYTKIGYLGMTQSSQELFFGSCRNENLFTFFRENRELSDVDSVDRNFPGDSSTSLSNSTKTSSDISHSMSFSGRKRMNWQYSAMCGIYVIKKGWRKITSRAINVHFFLPLVILYINQFKLRKNVKAKKGSLHIQHDSQMFA